MAYASWSVVFGEQPSASKWNILGTNDAAFNNGTGIPSVNSAAAYVATSQSTTSTSFTDLATAGPAATVTVGSTGLLLVGMTVTSYNSGANLTYTSFALSGANTLAASDKYSTIHGGTQAEGQAGSWLMASQTPGSTTVTMKYKANAGTGSWQERHIWAIPL